MRMQQLEEYYKEVKQTNDDLLINKFRIGEREAKEAAGRRNRVL